MRSHLLGIVVDGHRAAHSSVGFFNGRFERHSGVLALCVALLWSLHPLQTETVVYITQRTELLVGFFYLATLYASLRYFTAVSSATRAGWLTASALACIAGMACKEVMVTAPLVVLLFELTFITALFGSHGRNLGGCMLLLLQVGPCFCGSITMHRAPSLLVFT